MASYDTIIRNGTVVTQLGTFDGDIGIEAGQIKTLSSSDSDQASKVINADGKYVFPGVIDPHVHLSSARSFKENCTPETTSMAFGGVTSVLSFVTSSGTFDDVFKEEIDLISKESMIDVGLHAIIANIQQAEEIPRYARDYGVTSFKFYLGANGAELYPGTIGASDAAVYLGFQKISELGYPATAQVHAENWDICFMLRDKFIAEGKTGQADFADSRPRICEIECISRAILFAKYLKTRLYVVHVSTKEGPEMISDAREEGVNVVGETCPHYLALTKNDKHEVIAKVNPPIREKEDNEGLWSGLKSGGISCMGSDHIPGRSKQLASDNAFTSKAGGLPGSNMILPLLMSDGVRKGKLTLERASEVTSVNTAKWFGLYPKKGSLLPGSDADIAIVDPKREVLVTPESMHLTSDYTWFRGLKLVGFPMLTMVRGNIVFEDGELVGKAGRAKYLPRKVGTSAHERPVEPMVV